MVARQTLGWCAALGMAASAQAMGVSQQWELWLYGSAQDLSADAPFNPGNAVLRLPRSAGSAESRWQVQGSSESLDLKLRVRGVASELDCDGCARTQRDLYASQAHLRWKAGGGATVTVGRQLLTWGPGSFRSPSNPYYFDAGRTQPLRELSGIDALLASYSSAAWSLHAAQVLGSGHVGGSQGENFSGSQTGRLDYRANTLLRLDVRRESFNASAVASLQRHGAAFVGGYAAWNLDDAWMLWGEFGQGRRPSTLHTSTDPQAALAYAVQTPSPRAATWLAGASYTLESGQALQLEYLHDGHGLNGDDEAAYFATARRAGALLGGPQTGGALATLFQGLQRAPVSLSRHYLAAAWQSSPQDSSLFWRAMWAVNLSDGSHQPSLYVERSINRRLGWFVSATVNRGGASSEYGSLIRHSLIVGLKLTVI